MHTGLRRRKAVRRPPEGEPTLPASVRIILPPRQRIRWTQVLLALIPLALVGAGGWYAYKKFGAPRAEEEAPEELQEVRLEAEPPPEPEPEPETEPEEEPQEELPDLLSENDGALGPANDLSLDLALGTGSEGMAVGTGASRHGASGGTHAAYEPGQADQNPELQQDAPPEMPRPAAEKGVGGSFVATFVVGPNGKVEAIQITGSPQGYGFEEAIRKALLKRRYKPAQAGGVPVPMKIRQPFDFRLE